MAVVALRTGQRHYEWRASVSREIPPDRTERPHRPCRAAVRQGHLNAGRRIPGDGLPRARARPPAQLRHPPARRQCDEAIESAVKAGAKLVRPAQDQFYGERSSTVRDPFGYDWMLGHSIEEVEPAEMQRRYDTLMKG
jgi:hypothetical protein